MFCLFNKTSLGIDITDSRILLTRLKKSGGIIAVDMFEKIDLPPGVVAANRIVDREKLALAINTLFKKIKVESACDKRIIFGLPKNQVFVHFFTSEDNLSKRGSLEKIVQTDTMESIPLEADDIYYTYKVLNNTPGKRKFLVVAVSKKLLLEWQEFFSSINIDVQVYDLSSQATYRNLFKKMPKNPLCMIDLGSDISSITIFNSEGLRYSHALKSAGRRFTERIAEDLDVSFEEAEKIKIHDGLKTKSKARKSLEKSLVPLIKSAQEIFAYLESRTGEKIEKIIIVGGSALLKELPEYLSEKLNLPVEIGKPIISRNKADFDFLNSTGLALRGFENRSRQTDPGLSPIKTGKKKKIIVPVVEKGLDTEKNNSAIEVDYEKLQSEKKIKRQKLFLLLILVIGLAFLGWIYWYRQNKIVEPRNIIPETPFQSEEVLSYEIPIAVNRTEYSGDRVKGRIVESENKSVFSGESLWPEPVLTDPDRWLIYDGADLKTLVIAKLKSDNDSDFSLGEFNYLSVASTSNPNIFLIKAQAKIYLK